MSKPRVVAIVQARLGGTRLPGKVLLPINGRTLLLRHVERLRMVQAIDKIVVAIPRGAPNDPLAAYCRAQNWECYRGPEDDVLARYAGAAKKHKAKVIVRTTADCPLLDPGVVAGALRMFEGGGFDYVSNNLERTFPHGLDVEVFSRLALDDAQREAVLPFDREHVTEWIRRHQDRPYTLGNLRYPIEEAPEPYQRILREARLTVDYPEDLAVVKAIVEFWDACSVPIAKAETCGMGPHRAVDVGHEYRPATRHITTADVLWLLHEVPDIMELNRHRAAEHAQLLAGAFEPISEEGRAEVSEDVKAAVEMKH